MVVLNLDAGLVLVFYVQEDFLWVYMVHRSSLNCSFVVHLISHKVLY